MNDSPDAPRGTEPSEAQSRPVEAQQPDEQNPPLAVGGAASDLEGVVGTKNRAHFGKDPDNEVDPDGDTRSGQNPPNELSQRTEEAGGHPPSEKSQAAFKSGTLHTEGLAGQVEAALDDETPTTGSAPGAQNTGG